jgi:hypothetical protein
MEGSPVAAAPFVVLVDQHRILIDQHRTTVLLRDEHAADFRVAAIHQHFEVGLAFARTGEEKDAHRSRRRRAESGVDLHQRGGESLKLRGHRARSFLVRAADEGEVLRARQQPGFIGSGQRDRAVRLPRRGAVRGPFEGVRSVLRVRRGGEGNDREKDAKDALEHVYARNSISLWQRVG